MPYYDFQLESGEVVEHKLSFAEYEALPVDENGVKYIVDGLNRTAKRLLNATPAMNMNYPNGQRH